MRMHTVILSARGWAMEIDALIRYLYPRATEIQAMQERSDIVNNLVLACQERSTALEKIKRVAIFTTIDRRIGKTNYQTYHVGVDGKVDTSPDPFRTEKHPIDILLTLGYSLFKQMVDMDLYDDQGILKYTYRHVNNPFFNDVALDYMERLTWNGQHYEPIKH
jgi:hypothetical protein